jgi:hypothetical protein
MVDDAFRACKTIVKGPTKPLKNSLFDQAS